MAKREWPGGCSRFVFKRLDHFGCAPGKLGA